LQATGLGRDEETLTYTGASFGLRQFRAKNG
jgi:hypothetical protein